MSEPRSKARAPDDASQSTRVTGSSPRVHSEFFAPAWNISRPALPPSRKTLIYRLLRLSKKIAV
jgi:hypothetical protein